VRGGYSSPVTRSSVLHALRDRRNISQLLRFSLVGGSGVVINMVAVIACNKIGPPPDHLAVALPVTPYNIRYYHVYATIAFLLANLWNFQLNRLWAFRTSLHARWVSEYLPFLAVGLVALAINLGILTMLLHPDSLVALPKSVFDDSSGLRNRLYWAQLAAIAVVTPASFLLNRIWTFSAGLSSAGAHGSGTSSAQHPVVEPVAQFDDPPEQDARDSLSRDRSSHL
jgi:putative flippase GtrA